MMFPIVDRIKEKGHEILAPWWQLLCFIDVCVHCSNTSCVRVGRCSINADKCERGKGPACSSVPYLWSGLDWNFFGMFSLCHSQMKSSMVGIPHSQRWIEVSTWVRRVTESLKKRLTISAQLLAICPSLKSGRFQKSCRNSVSKY